MNQPAPLRPSPRYAARFCPHVTLVAILTPTIWAALLYLLMVR